MANHELIYRGKKVLDSFSKPILVCGCGAIGSNLIDNLVRIGFTNLTVLDMDRIEHDNIRTQIWSMSDIGGYKTAQIQNKMVDVLNVQVNTINKKLDTNNLAKLLKSHKLIVDAFDNTTSRTLIKKFASDQNVSCIHAGLFEDYGEVFWNETYTVPQDGGLDICDYPLARNIILLLVVTLTEEIIKWCTSETLNCWTITLKDLKISCLTNKKGMVK